MKPIETVLNDKQSTFSIEKAFSDGWMLISQKLGYYILFTILFFAISFLLGVIPFLGTFTNNLIVIPCLLIGFVIVTWNIHTGKGWNQFNDLFKGFNFLSSSVISTLIKYIVYILVCLPLIFKLGFNFIKEIIELSDKSKNGAKPDSEAVKDILFELFNSQNMSMALVTCLILLFLGIIWFFMYHFIAIYNQNGWDALESSRKVVLKNFNFPKIFLLMIMAGIINILGALLLGVGLLFTIPFTMATMYCAFAQITQCDEISSTENS